MNLVKSLSHHFAELGMETHRIMAYLLITFLFLFHTNLYMPFVKQFWQKYKIKSTFKSNKEIILAYIKS